MKIFPDFNQRNQLLNQSKGYKIVSTIMYIFILLISILLISEQPHKNIFDIKNLMFLPLWILSALRLYRFWGKKQGMGKV